jgi:hypothetical protein
LLVFEDEDDDEEDERSGIEEEGRPVAEEGT